MHKIGEIMTKKIKRKNAKKSNELINPETGLVRIYVDDCEIYNTLIKLRGISRSSFSIGNVVVHISPGSWIDPLARNKDVIFHIRHLSLIHISEPTRLG